MSNAEAITTLSQQRTINYVQVVSVTLLVFDWLLVFVDEVKYVWISRWSFVKVLYFWTRYSPIADTVLGLLSHFAFLTPEQCKVNNTANSCEFFDTEFCAQADQLYFEVLLGSGVYLSELVLIWRTFALWEDSKWVKYILGGVWLLMIPIDLYLLVRFTSSTVYAPQPVHGQPGCNLTKANSLIAGDFISLSVLEIGKIISRAHRSHGPSILTSITVIVVLTLIKGLRHMEYDLTHAPLLVTLYRDGKIMAASLRLTVKPKIVGVLFFICLSVLSVANVLAPVVGPKSNALLFPTFLRIMHSTLCCRVILHIRSAAAYNDLDDDTIARQTLSPRFAPKPQRRPQRTFVSIEGSEYIEMQSPVHGQFGADVQAGVVEVE
ncbi:hypothetical protein BC835DRAFT_1423502 [Cytidiella melzeri]|nr:hypothetical protein BC835DRAFT_1423502 [Cytidiella melzeri]